MPAGRYFAVWESKKDQSSNRLWIHAFSTFPDAKTAPAAKSGCRFFVIQGSYKWCSCGVVISTKRKIPFCHRHYFTFSKILPWQMKSTFVIQKYFLISYYFDFCTHACKIQFCFKNSRSTSSGQGVWFGYFSRSGAAAPSIM